MQQTKTKTHPTIPPIPILRIRRLRSRRPSPLQRLPPLPRHIHRCLRPRPRSHDQPLLHRHQIRLRQPRDALQYLLRLCLHSRTHTGTGTGSGRRRLIGAGREIVPDGLRRRLERGEHRDRPIVLMRLVPRMIARARRLERRAGRVARGRE